ncbi:MAG: InlB B-repeat-containing protein, partial [Bacteroidota bacterium]
GEDVMDASASVTMNDDVNVEARFTEIILPPATYTLTISTQGNGSTTPAAGTHEYEEGTEVPLTATAAEGWEFDKWVIDGEDVMDASASVTMNNDVNVEARFTEIILPPVTYTLTISTQGNGSTTPAAGTHEYEEGTEVPLTATAAEGWEFDKWVIDGEDVMDASASVTMNNDVNVEARFTELSELGSINFNGEILYISPLETESSFSWGGSGTITEAHSSSNGQNNTQTIISVIEANGGVDYAAHYCSNLTAKGYSDWYLPAKDELNAMYENRNSLGGYNHTFYWCSTEYSNVFAWYQIFEGGFQDYEADKANNLGVRCIRKD